MYIKGCTYGVIAYNQSQFQSYGASPAGWDYPVLPATRHRWTRPALTPDKRASSLLDLPTLKEWKAELT